MEYNENMVLSNFILDYFKNENIDSEKKDAVVRIIAHVLNTNKAQIYANFKDICIDKTMQDNIRYNLDEYLVKNVPLQYILGKQFFYNEEYIVDKNVLIPREDTEVLVKKAIDYIIEYSLKDMLDLCCGSGCIGISILNNSPIYSCSFVDISKEALEITNKNLVHNNVSKKVKVINSNLFDNITEKFDLIISNPPYIVHNEIKNLSKYVQNEPLIALDGGKDGMDIYVKILSCVHNYLNDSGILILEIGYDQMDKICSLIKKYDYFEILEKVKDYGGNDRGVICRFHQV